jgi:hypothetical protein
MNHRGDLIVGNDSTPGRVLISRAHNDINSKRVKVPLTNVPCSCDCETGLWRTMRNARKGLASMKQDSLVAFQYPRNRHES